MDKAFASIGVIGGGAWGTALATVAGASGAAVMIWAREPEVVESINRGHTNSEFLPDIPLADEYSCNRGPRRGNGCGCTAARGAGAVCSYRDDRDGRATWRRTPRS